MIYLTGFTGFDNYTLKNLPESINISSCICISSFHVTERWAVGKKRFLWR